MGTDNANTRQGGRAFFYSGLLLGVGYWVFDSVVMTFVLHERSFLEQLLSPSSDEIWERLFTLGLFTVFGSIAGGFIGQRRRAEDSLRESEEQLRLVVETVPHGIEEIDPSGTITFANSAQHRRYDYGKGELIGKSILEIVPSDSERESLRDYLKILVNEQPLPVPYYGRKKTRKGRIIDVKVDWNYKRDNQERVIGFVSVITDITEQKRVEEELRKSVATSRAFADAIPDMVFRLSKDGVYLDYRPGKEIRPFVPPSEFIGRTVFEVLPPEGARAIMETVRQALETEKVVAIQFPLLEKDGQHIYEARIAPCGKEETIAIVRDITKRRRAEEAVREEKNRLESVVEDRTKKLSKSNAQLMAEATVRARTEVRLQKAHERLRLTVESSPDAMVIADHEGLVTLVNSQTEKLFGYAREALLGKSIEMLVPERLRSKHREHRSGYAANPTVRPMGIGLELFGRHKDGSEFPIEISLSPFETDEGQFVSSNIRDITDRKRAQEALQELSARLIDAQEEERRRIARELHDDTSQRLALLAIELDQLGQHPPKSTAQLRERAQALCRRTQDIASEIHHLSRQLHPSILDQLGLVTAVRSYCGEISRQHGIQIIFNHDDVSSSISKSVSLCLYRIVQEAVQNVIKHSRAQKAQIELAERSGVLHLRVSDSGVGFDINSLQGKGGLGLVSMRERLRLVGGKLSIRSHPSQGTQIEVQVPLSSAA